ncbi:hypothetical protein [Pseudomonas viridiflava]|uniref:hypothetical protein n=2 Tax=Pseudomonas viridiflava TaxID=33069 RepID=UPI000F02C995|nr:hypothetical protein [Pseudomonas viridiflava]
MTTPINTVIPASDVDHLLGLPDVDVIHVNKVTCSKGKDITCRYLKSPHFSMTNDLCKSLHIMFVSYSLNAHFTNIYILRSGIELLLEFVSGVNARNPHQLQIANYTDINTEVFRGFQDFIAREKHSPNNAVGLKAAFSKTADMGILPRLILPVIDIVPKQKTEPLYKDGFETLQTACSTHIAGLYNKLLFREEVEKAKPYVASEVMDEIRPAPTRKRLLEWQKHVEVMKRGPHRETYCNRFARCPDPEIRELAEDPDGIRKFRAIYEAERAHIEFDGLANPFDKGAKSWTPDYARIIKTFLENNFPFGGSHEEVAQKYENLQLLKLEDDCDNIIKIILYRTSVANQKNRVEVQILTTDEILGLYYPTNEDMAALLTFMMFQSGWNKETVLSLDQDSYEHPLTGVIEEAIKVVYSEKNRSQNNGKPFEKPKRIHLPSRNDDPLSFYNLVGLCQRLAEPLATHPLDKIRETAEADKMNPLFYFIRMKGDWFKGGRYTSIAWTPSFLVGIKSLLKMYEVVDNGKRLESASELTRRLRPTWLLHKKKSNPISLLSTTMGHSDRDTTDIFYDDSGAARQERLQRLRTELEEIIRLLRARQFKGMLSKHAQAEASAQLKVYHLPGHDKPLWGCANQDGADWPGAELIASTSKKCYSIPNCIFCSQMRVFQDTLPFLIERAAHLQEILDEGDVGEIGLDTRFTKELEAIHYILDNWGDEDEIKAAARYRRRRTPLLPRDLKILEIIFESEEHNI